MELLGNRIDIVIQDKAYVKLPAIGSKASSSLEGTVPRKIRGALAARTKVTTLSVPQEPVNMNSPLLTHGRVKRRRHNNSIDEHSFANLQQDTMTPGFTDLNRIRLIYNSLTNGKRMTNRLPINLTNIFTNSTHTRTRNDYHTAEPKTQWSAL